MSTQMEIRYSGRGCTQLGFRRGNKVTCRSKTPECASDPVSPSRLFWFKAKQVAQTTFSSCLICLILQLEPPGQCRLQSIYKLRQFKDVLFTGCTSQPVTSVNASSQQWHSQTGQINPQWFKQACLILYTSRGHDHSGSLISDKVTNSSSWCKW